MTSECRINKVSYTLTKCEHRHFLVFICAVCTNEANTVRVQSVTVSASEPGSVPSLEVAYQLLLLIIVL